MRHLYTTLIGLAAVIHGISQEHPDWSARMKQANASFEEIVSLHRSLWPVVPTERGQGYKQFERFKWLYEGRLNEDGQLPSGSDVVHQWQALRNYAQSRSLSGNWSPLGPILDGITTRDHIEGVGRTASLAFHPEDPSILYCGAPAGGLWRSFDGGATWSTNTDWLPTLGVSSIVIDPNDPLVIYIGTGDRDAFDAPGMGVMKSTDGGENWSFANAGMEDLVVGALRLLPSGVLVAGTNEGIYRSTDGAQSWTYVSENTWDYKDLEVHPTNPDILYATGNGRFRRSIDAGLTWETITENIGSGTRMVIAVTPAQPDLVYVCKSNTYSFTGFYRSVDAGVTFEEMSDEPNILGWAADGSSSGGQAWYDLCIEASHDDPNVVYVGGIRIKQSNDGGATWIDINPNYVHVDQHEFIISPHDQDLYVCNDGGLYHYIANEEWLDISHGMVCGQIYKLGQSPHDPNHTLTGYQDNGTMEFNGAQWLRRGGGDGFECIYDFTDQEWRYGSIYYGAIYRTSPEFVNQKIGGEDELGINESGAWSSPYLLYPSDENTMLLGLKNVWRSRNIKHPERDSIVWEKISNNLMGSNTVDLVALESSMADHRILYASEGSRKLARTMDVLADSVVWVNLSTYLPSSLQPVRAIETHPTDTNTLYISFNKDVYKSVDGGLSWSEMTAELPDVDINTIVMDTTGNEEALYIGTDLGIYYKDALMTEWIPFNAGFPFAARVTELEIYYGPTIAENRIRAATYGRGLWESDLYSADTQNFPPVAFLSLPVEGDEVFGETEVDLVFYRSLNTVPMSGLEVADITAENATVLSVNGGPEAFSLTVEPTTYGEVKLYVPFGAANDEDGIGNFESDTLRLVYVAAPQAFGPFGPGGVGDENSLALWLRADMDTEAPGGIPAVDGMSVMSWNDISGQGDDAVQTSLQQMPMYVDGENGINGRPAIAFDGDNDYLLAEDVQPGRSVSGYLMAETDSIAFNDHGWFASARTANGYLMHPWKNEARYSAEVLDLEEDYSGTPTYYIGDAAAPHIYGFIYEQDDLHQLFYTAFDDELWDFPGIGIGSRSDEAEVDVRIGWDFEERFGKGKIAEHFVYNRRLFLTHHRLVSNYLAAKYGVDLGPAARYHHPEQPLDVVGIGREHWYDLHTDAQGTGVLRIQSATSLDDGDYLLIGDDGASLDLSEDLFPILSPRTERTWGVDKTNDPGSVTIRLSANAIDEISGLGILYAEGDAFTAGEPVGFVPFTVEGDELVAVVDFPQHGVFAIGVSPVVSVPDLAFAEVRIFPNPADEHLEVTVGKVIPESWQVVLFDVTGAMVEGTTVSGERGTIDVSALAPGWYAAEVRLGEGQVRRFPVVIR